MRGLSRFIDRVKIFVEGGSGGKGCISFRREKSVARGGPNGGSGGKGGDVILEGDRGLLTLLDFKYRPQIKASRGGGGRGSDCDGRSGADAMAKVPLGTIAKDIATDKQIGEVLKQGQQLVVARGGRGGRGNKQFATSTNRAPRKAELGVLGEKRTLELELKLIADVGLVGAPNAGKSTLINYISTAKSKVASYPFTTLNPVLGVVALSDDSSEALASEESFRMVVADMPGLIKGAYRGKGLGDRFLRHIERTRILVFILDMGDKPLNDFFMLREELEQYSHSLSKKAYLIAANKIDLENSEYNLSDFFIKSGVEKNRIFPISALKGKGIDKLLGNIRRELNESRT